MGSVESPRSDGEYLNITDSNYNYNYDFEDLSPRVNNIHMLASHSDSESFVDNIDFLYAFSSKCLF
jgi:hypothetical protein